MQDASFQFQFLTPELIVSALAALNLYPESGLTPLNSYENRVYLFQAEDRQRYVVKFYRSQRWNLQQLQEEHELTQFLLAHDVPVIAPVVQNGYALHQVDGFYYAVWPYRPGRGLELDNMAQLEMVGQALGRWHARASNYTLQHRPEFNAINRVTTPINYLLQHQPWGTSALPWDALLAQLQQQLQTHALFSASQLALHGDCHAGNILWRDEPVILDLDDCVMGPAMQDIWMLLSGDENEQRQQLYTILDGYETYCEFDERQLGFIEPLRTLRMLNYLVWLHRRWQDPAFPQAFPWFNQHDYWQNQFRMLTEQAQLLEQPKAVINYNC
ncbi:serine/threonine protein kinase [Tolumonas osonensis]|uniref:Stress response kinase A n=1 Tax=Tolumonas osonensis TaxID=675874 RepID=A0A841GB99_9GAMM|nr:serine/threonine protein kinase [Tolumonas osonensis]MBB6056414.1 Ser/Thr protein kinase RdoA (MazF antagonist) [Tolumonas osonensis]